MFEFRYLRATGAACLAFLCLGAAPAAMAATATGTFQVTAEVQAQCEVDTSTTDMDFGVIDVTTVNNATSTLAYRCTSGTAPDAALTYTQMTGTGGSLPYTLYQDSSRTVVWAAGADSQTLPAATGYATADTVTVYGQVTAADAGSAGVGADYADTVTVTLTF